MKLKEIIDYVISNDLKVDECTLNDFYRLYINTFNECSEAPPKFILTVLFASLGSSISLSRWISWGTRKIFPNFWVIIIGESTTSRKTTSLDNGLKMIKMHNKDNPNRHYLLPSRSSMSSLLEVLVYEKNGVIEHSELATFLELLKKGFNVDMKSLLTNFFDVPPSYKINFKTTGNTNLQYPIFSIATATTPVWLKHNLSKGDATSGFLARFLFAFQNKKTRSIPIPMQPDAKKIKKLNKVFKQLFELKPKEITFDQEFRTVYEEFYHESDELIEKLAVDNGLKSIFSRLQTDYFLKFTILECVLTGKTTASKDEALRARYLVAFYMAQAIATIERITPNEQMELETKILKFIKDEHEVTSTEIHRYFNNHMSSQKLNSVLSSLIKAGLIVKDKSTRKRNVDIYKPNS